MAIEEATLTVLDGGKHEFSTEPSDLKPGVYHIIPDGLDVHETRHRRIIERAPELVMHLGELKGWYRHGKVQQPRKQQEILAKYGIATTMDLQSVGWAGLTEIEQELPSLPQVRTFRLAVDFLKRAMSDLGIEVPQRGKLPDRAKKSAWKKIMADYVAYKRTNKQRDEMAAVVNNPVSRIEIMESGAHILCGNCEHYHGNVPLSKINGLHCNGCGRDLEVDYNLEVKRRPWMKGE